MSAASVATLSDVASLLTQAVEGLQGTFQPVSFLSDMQQQQGSRPTSAADAVAVLLLDKNTTGAPPGDTRPASWFVDSLLTNSVKDAEVQRCVELLRSAMKLVDCMMVTTVQQRRDGNETPGGGASSMHHELEGIGDKTVSNVGTRTLSVMADRHPNDASGPASNTASFLDVTDAAKSRTSLAARSSEGRMSQAARSHAFRHAFADVDDTDVARWLNETFANPATRATNGMELVLDRRVSLQSESRIGADDDKEDFFDPDDAEDDDVPADPNDVPLLDVQLQDTIASDAVGNRTDVADRSTFAVSRLQPAANEDTGGTVSDKAAASSRRSKSSTTRAKDTEAGAVSSEATPRGEARAESGDLVASGQSPNAATPCDTNGVNPSASASRFSRGSRGAGATAPAPPPVVVESAVNMKYTRATKRSFPAMCGQRRFLELLDHMRIPHIPDINLPEFDVFAASDIHGSSLLVYVAANVFFQYNFVRSLQMDVEKLIVFFETVRMFYRDENPYHNAIHASDVLQTTNVYLCVNDVKENFSDVELFALLFAAVVHDVGHLGIANAFLTKIRHPLARLYNDMSPLENSHASLAFAIFERPECYFIASSEVFTRGLYDDFRGLVIEALFGTDMRLHAEQTKSVCGILEDGVIEDHEVGKLLKAILHAADLSNPMKPLPIYFKWVDRVMAEFWQQGDEERRRNMPVSVLCDRNGTNTAKSQMGFISFVVKPFVRELAPVLPSVWLERLDSNSKALGEMTAEDEAERVRNITQFAAKPWVDVDMDAMPSSIVVLRDDVCTAESDAQLLQPKSFTLAQTSRRQAAEDVESVREKVEQGWSTVVEVDPTLGDAGVHSERATTASRGSVSILEDSLPSVLNGPSVALADPLDLTSATGPRSPQSATTDPNKGVNSTSFDTGRAKSSFHSHQHLHATGDVDQEIMEWQMRATSSLLTWVRTTLPASVAPLMSMDAATSVKAQWLMQLLLEERRRVQLRDKLIQRVQRGDRRPTTLQGHRLRDEKADAAKFSLFGCAEAARDALMQHATIAASAVDAADAAAPKTFLSLFTNQEAFHRLVDCIESTPAFAATVVDALGCEGACTSPRDATTERNRKRLFSLTSRDDSPKGQTAPTTDSVSEPETPHSTQAASGDNPQPSFSNGADSREAMFMQMGSFVSCLTQCILLQLANASRHVGTDELAMPTKAKPQLPAVTRYKTPSAADGDMHGDGSGASSASIAMFHSRTEERANRNADLNTSAPLWTHAGRLGDLYALRAKPRSLFDDAPSSTSWMSNVLRNVSSGVGVGDDGSSGARQTVGGLGGSYGGVPSRLTPL